MKKKRPIVQPAPLNRYGIYIDGGGRPQVVADGIMRILDAPHADEATKVAALAVLREAASAPTTISNCTIGMPA